MQNKFSFETFTNLAKMSIVKAEDYRKRCSNVEIEVIEVSPIAEEIVTEDIEISRDDMKEILIKAGVDFKGNMSNIGLLELIKEKGLI